MFRDGLRIGGVDRRSSGAWSNGDILSIQNGTLVAGSAGGHYGAATVDFGAAFTDSASVVVTGQTWVTASSHVRAWFQDDSTADTTAGEHEFAALAADLVVTARSAGVGFTIDVYLWGTDAKGEMTVHWGGA